MNGNIRPYYDVGNDVEYKENATFFIYASSGSSLNVTINNAGAGCQTTPPTGGAAGGPDYNDDGSSNGPTTQFYLGGPSAITAIQSTNGSDGCGVTRSFSIGTINSSNSLPITDGKGNQTNYNGLDRYVILYVIVPPTSGPGGENSFWLSSSTNKIGASNLEAGYGFRDKSVALGHHWSNQVIFGVLQSCNNLNPTISSNVSWLDTDVGVYGDPNLTLAIQRKLWTDNSNNWNSWVDSFTPSQNGSKSLTFDSAYRYRLLLRNVGTRNTVFLELGAGLSQLAGHEQMQASDCGSVSCNITPGTQTVAQNTKGLIDITGVVKSGATWKSTYFIKRTGPTYTNVTNEIKTSPPTYEDQVTYTGTSPETYSYVVWDSATNTQVSDPGQGCQQIITWTKTVQPSVYCTAMPSNLSPTAGVDADTIAVTLYNNGNTNLQGDQLRQISTDMGSGGVWPVLGFGNFTKGEFASHTYSQIVRPKPITVIFKYYLFTGTAAGSPLVPNIQQPVCTATITWSASGGQNLSINCVNTTVPKLSTTATYTKVITVQDPGFWTSADPSTWGSYPYPPGPPMGTIASPPVWWYVPPPRTVYLYNQPADEIPFYINFVGSDGSNVPTGTYFIKPVPGGYSFPSTFGAFGFLKPHVSYTATLYAQTMGDLGDNEGGPYHFTTVGQPQPLQQCLHAAANACVGGDSPVAPPGSVVQSTYRIVLDNLTNKDFNTSFGYNLLAHPDGQGLVPNGNMSQAVDIPPGQNTIQGTFSFVTYYRGTYWVEFRYQNARVDDLPDQSWPGTCGSGGDSVPPVTIIPEVKPYLQAWENDAAAGGGFRNVSYQCPTTYPAYVSPVTKGSNFAGGIRAMSSSSIQSKSDFGAVALGIIPNPSNEGFFVLNRSGKNIYFANINQPGGSQGGFLDSTSPNHCIDDYYTNTQVDPNNTPTLNDLQTDIYNCPLDTSTNSHRCQFKTDGTTLSGGIIIPDGYQISVYVNGDVTVDTDIVYQEPFNPNDRSTVPYFALIAKGNITLTNNVHRLDGLYVAQPNGGSGGVFATCDSQCNSQLVVNGAVIAQHVELLRAHGSSQPLNNDINGIGTNPAEIINFTPAMILGAPAFNPMPNTPEGLFSLSPVF